MKLTPRQEQIYEFIKTYTKRHKESPTFVEIAEKFKFYHGAAVGHVEAMIKKGYLSREYGHEHRRSIRILK